MRVSVFACRKPFARPNRSMLSRQAVAQIQEEGVSVEKDPQNTRSIRMLCCLLESAVVRRITAVCIIRTCDVPIVRFGFDRHITIEHSIDTRACVIMHVPARLIDLCHRFQRCCDKLNPVKLRHQLLV